MSPSPESQPKLISTSLPQLDLDMSSLESQLPYFGPSAVQTILNPFTIKNPFRVPASAISASSVASSSHQGSPTMSPGTTLTSNSSVQGSPHTLPTQDDDQCPPFSQLPESLLSRRTSNTSMGPSVISSTNGLAEATPTSNGVPNAMAEAFGSNANQKGNLIRRLSNRAQRFTTRRRQSSVTPMSRDGSVGPSILRRRSDSNATAQTDCGLTDTDEDVELLPDEEMSLLFLDGVPNSSGNSTTASVNGSISAMAGPVLPMQLQNGEQVNKVSRKNRLRKVQLFYETETNKLIWDKSRPNKSLHVDEIKEIRVGTDIQQYCLDFGIKGDMARKGWFTIIYNVPEKSRTKYLHIITESPAALKRWTGFLDAMLKYRQDRMTSLMAFDHRAIAQFWQSETSKLSFEGEEELDLAAVKRVCHQLHIYSSEAIVEGLFSKAAARKPEKLNFTEFKEFVGLMKERRDIQRIVRSMESNWETGITRAEFFKFLREVQGEDVNNNLALWEQRFKDFTRGDKPVAVDGTPTMSEAAFVAFLNSEFNGPMIETPAEITHDRPMNEYIISSSHNTYLLGRQVAGNSSVEGYISALTSGCRCVEVDCWDGSNGEPVVNHGRTLTTSIGFEEVMTTINKYAFQTSKFPLWISLEVHCSPSQQIRMVELIKEAFGSKLVTEPLADLPDTLPSPSQLMERILIKVKKPQAREEPPINNDFRGRRRGNSLNSPLVRPTIPDGAILMPSQSLPQSPMLTPSHSSRRLMSKSRVNTITEGQVQDLLSSSTSDNESTSEKVVVKKSSNKTVKVLGELGVYCAGVKFAGFDTPDAKAYNHIFSFMESSFAKHSRIKEEKMALNIHNMRYLMRVYPDRTRITSNNFDPLIYWRRGVQMAALNWQTFDLGMQLNRAMFQGGTDSSGYILKPTELRNIQVFAKDGDVVEARAEAIAQGKKERSVLNFSIDVISAQQLMRPANLPSRKSMNPYIEVEVFHANDKRDKNEADTTLDEEPELPLKYQTSIIRENGFNPLFDKECKFKVVTKHPELVFVRWSVKLADDNKSYDDRPAVATYTAKLQNLKQGYRTLPLLNHKGDQYLFSKLFCKITVDPVEKMMIDAPRRVQDGNKFNRLGGKVFSRMNTSPKNTIERSSMERSSIENST